MANSKEKVLNLKLKDGTVHTYLLNGGINIQGYEKNRTVRLWSSSVDVVYSVEDIYGYTFGENTTGVECVNSTSLVKRKGDCIIFNGVREKEIFVSDISGKDVKTLIRSLGTECVVDLSSLPNGLYIVSAAKFKFKVLKK